MIKIPLSDKKTEAGKITIDGEKIFIGCKTGSIQILKLQPEGKKEMKDKNFANGYFHLNNQNLS